MACPERTFVAITSRLVCPMSSVKPYIIWAGVEQQSTSATLEFRYPRSHRGRSDRQRPACPW